MYLDYTYGLEKIYSKADIEKAKASPSFKREVWLRPKRRKQEKEGVGLGWFVCLFVLNQCVVANLGVQVYLPLH